MPAYVGAERVEQIPARHVDLHADGRDNATLQNPTRLLIANSVVDIVNYSYARILVRGY